MRGTRGEAPHPGRVTGVSMFISMFLFLVVVSEYRHQWLRYARPVWQVVGGECPASGVGVFRLCVPLRVRACPVASMPMPFLALAYYALTLTYRNCLACGACHVHGPVHMVHIGERHRRQTKEKAVTLRE